MSILLDIMPYKPKIAIVGIGRWGKNLLREFNEISEVIACCHNGNKENVEWLQEHYPQFPRHTDVDEMLKDTAIQAVVIATPIESHYEIVMKALVAGKHVFVEKPLSMNVKESHDASLLAQKKDLVLFVGYIFLFHPIFQKLKKELEHSSPRFADFHWSKFGTFHDDIKSNLLPHELSLMIELFGKAKSGTVLGSKEMITKEDILISELRFENGAQAFSYINRVAPTKQKRITISDGTSIFTWQDNELYKTTDKKQECIYKSEADEPLKEECKYFIMCITDRSLPVLSDGDLSSRVSEAISYL